MIDGGFGNRRTRPNTPPTSIRPCPGEQRLSILCPFPRASHPQAWGHGGCMEEVWRGSHVDCVTSWYCATYEVKNLTPKCVLLIASSPGSFIQMIKPPLKLPFRLPLNLPVRCPPFRSEEHTS